MSQSAERSEGEAKQSEVKTTIDREMQKMVREQIRKVICHLKPLNVTNAAAILLDNHTGQVLAYVGSADYFDEKNEGQNDGVMASRQLVQP